MPKVINDFFGGLNGSIGIALRDNPLYEVRTFDIEPTTKDGRKNIVIDLTEDITTLIPKLVKYGMKKGQIITGSPPCIAWSRAASMKGGSAGFYNMNGLIKVKLRPEEHFIMHEFNGFKKKEGFRYKFKNIRASALLGKSMLDNMIAIIEYFEPKYWYVENPKPSLMWIYWEENYKLKGYKNSVHYGAYGGISRKPTIFMSNIKMNLSKAPKGWKQKTKWEEIRKKDRSDIPETLLQEIFYNFWKEEHGE